MTLLAFSFEPPLLTFHPFFSAIPVLILECFSAILQPPQPTETRPAAMFSPICSL
jgi:hypothetical protein